jgi:hypothetical protein
MDDDSSCHGADGARVKAWQDESQGEAARERRPRDGG